MFELYRGCENQSDKDNIYSIIRYFKIYQINELVAEKAPELFNEYHNGTGIPDYLIAATCIINNLVFVTNNIKHFKMMSGFRMYGYKDNK